MTPDARAVHQLLSSLLAWCPGPATVRSNPLSWREDSGEAPSAKKPCAACGGHGTWGKHAKRCDVCKGRGVLVVDAYTLREVSTAEAKREPRTIHVRCDSCSGDGAHGNGRRCRWCAGAGYRLLSEASDNQLERLEAQERIRQGTEAADPYATAQERRERQYEQGSYAELDVAMRKLHRHAPSLHRLLLHVVVYAEPITLTATAEREIERGCKLLAAWMPKPIRVPMSARVEPDAQGKGRWANGCQQGERNAQIRALVAQGVSPTRVASEFGLSRRAVQHVVYGREARRVA